MDVRNLLLDGVRLNAQVENNLTGGEYVRTMDGASSLTLDLHDPDRELLLSGALTARPRGRRTAKETEAVAKRREGQEASPWDRLGRAVMQFGPSVTGTPAYYRMAGLETEAGTLTLDFEDEIVALLRQHDKPRQWARGKFTRAQVIQIMAREVRARQIVTYIPALRARQRVAKPDEDPNAQQGKLAKQDKDIRIKGQRATRDQRRNVNTVLRVIQEENAPETAALALLAGVIGESGFKTHIENLKGSGAKGVFQIMPANTHVVPWDDVELGARIFLNLGFTNLKSTAAATRAAALKNGGPEGAIYLARKFPDLSPGTIALLIEGSDAPDGSFYEGPILDEARAILSAAGGIGGPTIDTYVTERYLFRRGSLDGDREDSFDAMLRLASEVQWRLYIANDVLVYAHDLDLLRARPILRVAERPPINGRHEGDVFYVGEINCPDGWHYNKPATELRFEAPAERWIAYPGAVIEVLRMGPWDGDYLLAEIRETFDDSIADITLRRASPPKPEPAPDTRRARFGRLAPSLDSARTGGAKAIADALAAIGMDVDPNIYVGSALRPPSVLASGSYSDHSANDENMAARDIGYHGIDLIHGPPHPTLDEACQRMMAAVGETYKPGTTVTDPATGKPFRDVHWKGFRIQFIWRTPEYGGHCGHCHVGVRRLGYTYVPT